MNTQRAKQIASSPVMANVTCDGVPIYIQNVDDKKQTARIYPLNEPESERDVPLGSLIEH